MWCVFCLSSVVMYTKFIFGPHPILSVYKNTSITIKLENILISFYLQIGERKKEKITNFSTLLHSIWSQKLFSKGMDKEKIEWKKGGTRHLTQTFGLKQVKEKAISWEAVSLRMVHSISDSKIDFLHFSTTSTTIYHCYKNIISCNDPKLSLCTLRIHQSLVAISGETVLFSMLI